MLLVLLACWIGPDERAAWVAAHRKDPDGTVPELPGDTAQTGDTGTDPDDADGDGFPNEGDSCPDDADLGFGTDLWGCPYEWDPDTVERDFVVVVEGTAYGNCTYYDADTPFVDGAIDWTLRNYIPAGGTHRESNEADGHVDFEYLQTPYTEVDILGETLRSDSTHAGQDWVDYLASSTPGGDVVTGGGGGRSFGLGFIVRGDFFDDVPADDLPTAEALMRGMGDTWSTDWEGSQLWFPTFACSVDQGEPDDAYEVWSIEIED